MALAIKVDVEDGGDFASTLAAARALPSDLKRKVAREGKTLAQPLADAVERKARSQGKIASIAGASTKATIRQAAPAVVLGGGSGLASKLVFGAEFGGGVKRLTYYSRSSTGARYLITLRHTTRHFRPHKGATGYFFWPTIRAEGDLVLKPWADSLDKAIAEWSRG